MIATDRSAQASRYAFDNTFHEGGQLRLLAEILDEHTTAVLAGTGVDAGWRCLDVGPGAGTISRWLADRVLPGGQVTALDLEPRHLDDGGVVEVWHDDVRTARLPQAHYDLIHVRLLLLHLAERDEVLGRLVAALRPGGIIVVSDWEGRDRDWLLRAASPAHEQAFGAFQDGLLGILEDHGADLGWARRAPLAMLAAGLTDLDTVVHTRLWAGGEPGCLLHLSNAQQLRDALLGRGVTTGQLDLLEDAMTDPATLAYCYAMFTSVARRPE